MVTDRLTRNIAHSLLPNIYYVPSVPKSPYTLFGNIYYSLCVLLLLRLIVMVMIMLQCGMSKYTGIQGRQKRGLEVRLG